MVRADVFNGFHAYQQAGFAVFIGLLLIIAYFPYMVRPAGIGPAASLM